MDGEIRSYTSLGGQGALREFGQLLRRAVRWRAGMEKEVREALEMVKRAESFVLEQTGRPVRGLDALEIGPGQVPRQTAYFAMSNRVTGIDLDVAPQGWNPAGYYALWKQNGIKRLIKTLARKVVGVDAAFRREMGRQLGVEALPGAKVLRMDAARMSFPEGSFDFAYSFDVFEHFADPGAVLGEMRRVLPPGGRALSVIHPYTCDTGCHDLRLYLPGRGGLGYWPHLREGYRNLVRSFAYLNRLRLREWREVFERVMPGARFDYWKLDEGTPAALEEARGRGELADYSDEELLTDRLVVVWEKAK